MLVEQHDDPSRSNEQVADATSVKDRIMAHLRDEPRARLCATCLGSRLGLKTSSVYDAARKLEGHRAFSRRYGTCSACRSDRTVLGVASP